MAKEKTSKLKSKYAFKHGAYAIVFTAVVIAAIIIVNVLVSALGQRFPLSLDITADKDYSVSGENLDYIRKVERPVTITVCATEGSYSQYMAQYASYYYMAQDKTDGKYFEQTLTLLDEYKKHNGNIEVVYADPQSPEFTDIQQRVGSSASLSYGSILVESTFELDGKEVYRSKVLGFSDLYEVTDRTGGYASYYGYGYVVSGSKVESAVTSAIYSVTSDKTTEVTYISGNMQKDVLNNLNSVLADNNYNVTEIDNLLSNDIGENTEVLVIAAPTNDFSAAELAKLDKFLDNDGQRGKTLLFFASASSPELPNLYAFLAEWGINVGSGTVYETNQQNTLAALGWPQTIFGLQNKASDFTASVNGLSKMYVSGVSVPITIGFESQGNRVTTELLSTSETVVNRPVGAGDDWKPGNEAAGKYSAAVVSTDTLYAQDYSELKSYVVAFSSADFISEDMQFTSTIGNMDLAVGLVNVLSGRDADTVTFTNKTITVESFADKVTGASVVIVYVLFIIIVPVAVLAVGIFVYIRRRRR